MGRGNCTVVWAGLLLVAATSPAAAQQARARAVVTLPEAIEMAERVQPRVVQALGSIRSADARKLAANGAWFPSLTLTGSGTNDFSEGTSRLDPASGTLISGNRTTTSVRSTASATFELFDGFRRSAESRAASATGRAADANYTDARFQQALTTTNQFFDALAAQQLLAVREAGVARAREQLNTSIARLQTGAATRSDTLRSSVLLGNAQLALLTAETQLATAEANLARLIGAEGRVGAADDSVFYATRALIDTVSLRAEALARAPQVLAAEATQQAARATMTSSKSAYWPTLNLTGSANVNSSSTTDFRVFRGRSLSLNFNWPIFNRFTREQQVATQSIAYDNAEAAAGEARRQVQADLTTRLAELDAARLRIQITQASVAAAEEDLRVQQERYRLGAGIILDVLTSQEALSQAEVDAVNARFDYLRAKAQIETLIGRSL